MREFNRETCEAYGLAAIGAAQGFFRYYIQPELKERSSNARNSLTASRAWAGIIAGVTIYELACPQGELLSEGIDRAIEKHPVAVPLAIGITALHLCNLLPEKIDPFSRITDIIK